MSEIINVPWLGVSGGSLTLDPAHAFNPARGFEHDQIVDFGLARWQLQIELNDRTTAETGVMRAFLARLAMGARFRCHDPLRSRPLAYAFGCSRPWLANPAVEATLSAINPASWTVGISDLVAGAIISPGDAISWVTVSGGEHRIHRVSELAPVVANSSGVATVRVSPRPRAAATGGTVKLSGATSVFFAPGIQSEPVKPGPLPGDFSIAAVEVPF
jgi:hypothetical protein